MRTKWIGWTAAIVSTLSFSITAPIARVGMQAGMHPTALTAARFSLGWLLLGVTVWITGLGRMLPQASRFSYPKDTILSHRIGPKGLGYCLLAGLSSGFASLAYFWAISRINASITSMLVSLYPLIVLLFLALRGERLTPNKIARLALGMGGIYLLLGPGAEGGRYDTLGILLALLCAFIFSIQLVVTQWFLTEYPSVYVAYYVIGVTALVALGIWIMQGAPWIRPGIQGWLVILVLAVFCAYISRLAMIRAIQEIGSGQVALLSPVETMLTVLWSVLFLQERLSFLQWIGSGLILSSAILAAWRLRVRSR